MKRYNIPYVEWEDEQGEWVKWDDVKKLEFAYSNLLKEFGELSKKLAGCIPDVEECNCARMTNAPPYNHRIPLNLTAFICPLHGYKRV